MLKIKLFFIKNQNAIIFCFSILCILFAVFDICLHLSLEAIKNPLGAEPFNISSDLNLDIKILGDFKLSHEDIIKIEAGLDKYIPDWRSMSEKELEKALRELKKK